MPIQFEAAQALAAVQRARSLFGTPEPATTGGAPMQSAADSVTGAGQQASRLAGRAVERHAVLTETQHRQLAVASGTDTTLESYLRNAALATEHGARRLDTVVAQTNSIANVAAKSQTPAAQLLVLTALLAQVAHAQAVTAATTQ